MKFYKRVRFAPVVGMMAVSMAWGGVTANAQSTQPTAPSSDLIAYNFCSTTDVTSAAATALSITSAELRKDIVAGQSLQAIAQSKNVDPQTVATAIQAANKAGIDQAVTDGTLTQDEATALEAGNFGPGNGQGPQGGQGQQGNPPSGQAPQDGQAPLGTAQAGQAPQGQPAGQPAGQRGQGGPGGQGGQNQLPDINNLYFLLQSGTANASGTQNVRGPRGGGMGANFNVVKPYVVAAQALNMKCSALVKTLATTSGATITAVAADQKVDTKIVTDALTKAYTDALAQDVKDGIITQAQSDQVSKNLDQAVTNFVSNAGMQRGPRPAQG